MFSKGANEWKRVCTICENCGDHEAANFAKVNVIVPTVSEELSSLQDYEEF